MRWLTEFYTLPASARSLSPIKSPLQTFRQFSPSLASHPLALLFGSAQPHRNIWSTIRILTNFNRTIIEQIRFFFPIELQAVTTSSLANDREFSAQLSATVRHNKLESRELSHSTKLSIHGNDRIHDANLGPSDRLVDTETKSGYRRN